MKIRVNSQKGRALLCSAILMGCLFACSSEPAVVTFGESPSSSEDVAVQTPTPGLPSLVGFALPFQPSSPDLPEEPSEPSPSTRGIPVESCEFTYDFSYSNSNDWVPQDNSHFENEEPFIFGAEDDFFGDAIAYLEPLAETTWQLPLPRDNLFFDGFPTETLTMPGYHDDMPIFERAGAWETETRCYELPSGAVLLTEEEAYELYVEIIQETLWYELNQTLEFRTVVGFRGAHPGLFEWNGNLPNRFNDTIVLLWRDDAGAHVREFPIITDTGSYDFGYHSSSSIKPNRHYSYINGWHRSYNALKIQEWSYNVRDDSNHNGHWDGDRNGWYSSGDDDHDRTGSGHNIHMAAKNAPLGDAAVNNWSAGCHVIPGVANWTEFLSYAWTGLGDPVDYFLIDTRDIAPAVWSACDAGQGTHACPHEIREFPFVHQGDTSASTETSAQVYNCSTADESGPEVVYVVNIRQSGTLSLSVSVENDVTTDPDVHILWGDEADACLARGHREASYTVGPGRYLIVVDTWVNDEGEVLAGEYDLTVDFD